MAGGAGRRLRISPSLSSTEERATPVGGKAGKGCISLFRLDGQIGKYRVPPTSRNSTIGAFDGISTRTPTTSSSRMRQHYFASAGLQDHPSRANGASHRA
jgi:hypothetical protein